MYVTNSNGMTASEMRDTFNNQLDVSNSFNSMVFDTTYTDFNYTGNMFIQHCYIQWLSALYCL